MSVLCGFHLVLLFFFSSRRRHTICALVTGVQTCALPIFELVDLNAALFAEIFTVQAVAAYIAIGIVAGFLAGLLGVGGGSVLEIGRASCRGRVCQYV